MSHQLTPHEAVVQERTMLGFWLYVMTDCILFATLFAVYAVMHTNTNGGLGAHDLFSLPNVLAETLLLLTSSFTCGVAMLAVHRRQQAQTAVWFAITFVLGLAFLALELTEFRQLAAEGNNWQRSGFLSSFFVLVGTHGAHITVGLLWMAALVTRLVRRGFSEATVRRFMLLSIFWHFLDVVWIFIFTVVYLMGAAG